jgi:MraZ protein
MPLFLSTFVNKIDKKGRVSVPASFRSSLAGGEWSGVVLYRSHVVPALVGADLAYMQRYSDTFDELMSMDDPEQALAAQILADSRQLAFDPEGRIVIPEDLLGYAGVTGELAFVGRGKTFQIWEPEAFRAHEAKVLDTVKNNRELLISQKRKNPDSGGRP